jgi:hypothetical protein
MQAISRMLSQIKSEGIPNLESKLKLLNQKYAQAKDTP